MKFDRVAVIGVGLIGGSFALALKKKRLCRHVVGVGRSQANLRKAQRIGAIDSIATLENAVRDADLVLLATPVSHFPSIFRSMKKVLNPKTLITDGGSTKRDVVAAAKKGLGRRIAQFVPAHPIAGAEKSGAAAAHAGLFAGKRVVVTPLRANPPEAVRRVEAAWQACGARVGRMTPEDHDRVFAAVSHLPHVLAYALVSELRGRRNARQLFGYAAGGFRDFTRIASSHPEMWRDICVANHRQLAFELSRFGRKLKSIRKNLRKGKSLYRLFSEARSARERWLAGDYA